MRAPANTPRKTKKWDEEAGNFDATLRRHSDRNHLDRFHATNQGVTAGIVNLNLDKLTGLSVVAVEDHDAVTMGPSGHLRNML